MCACAYLIIMWKRNMNDSKVIQQIINCEIMETNEIKSPIAKKVSKFWEACQKLKGNIEVYDPMLLV